MSEIYTLIRLPCSPHELVIRSKRIVRVEVGLTPFAFHPGLRNITLFTRTTLIGFRTRILPRDADSFLLFFCFCFLFVFRSSYARKRRASASLVAPRGHAHSSCLRILSSPGRHDGTAGYFLGSYETFQGRFRPDGPRSVFLLLFAGRVVHPPGEMRAIFGTEDARKVLPQKFHRTPDIKH